MQHLMTKPHAVKISAAALSKVAPFCAKNDIRYYITGIAVIPLASGGVLAVGTNGYAFLCMRDPDGHAERTVILPISSNRNKSALKPGSTIRMTDDGAIFTESSGIVRFVVPEGEIQAKFPDITKVFGTSDRYEQGIRGPFALPLLQLVAGAGKYDYVRFWTRDDNAGMFTVGKDIFGGLMPLRDDHRPPGIADIIPAELFEQPAAVTAPAGEG